MSQDQNQMDPTANPYAAYGYSPQSYNPYEVYTDPRQQFGYGFPYQQPAQQGFQGVPQMQMQPQFPTAGAGSQTPGMLPLEESFIENILRLNKGKNVTVYMTFEGNTNKVFKGVLEAAGRDHIILSDPQTGMRYLLLMVYLDYVTFPEEINYSPQFGAGLTQYSPR